MNREQGGGYLKNKKKGSHLYSALIIIVFVSATSKELPWDENDSPRAVKCASVLCERATKTHSDSSEGPKSMTTACILSRTRIASLGALGSELLYQPGDHVSIVKESCGQRNVSNRIKSGGPSKREARKQMC
jgi:hypothetical protein